MHLHNLTPYGLFLASVAACTAIVVISSAQNHGIPLKGVTVDTSYDRIFADDCDDCDENKRYEEIIKEKLNFKGDLDSIKLKRLDKVTKACSIRKLFENGIQVHSD